MKIPEYYPYRSSEAKEIYLAAADRAAGRWPVAAETRMVRTAYGETFVRISGPERAQPLVILPGMTTSSLFWAPNIEALSTAYRTYAVDRIGDVGRSTCTRRMTRVCHLVGWLDELFSGLGLGDEINLMGLSYGGWLAALYALHFPKRLRRMVLLAPGGTVLRTRVEFLLRGALFLTGRRSFANSAVHWLAEDLAREDPERVAAWVDRSLLTLRCIRPRLPVAPTVFTDRQLRNLRVPALFLVGEHEKIYSAARAVRRLTRVAPQIRTESVRQAGHDLTIVQAEKVNRKILEFLRGDGTSGAAG